MKKALLTALLGLAVLVSCNKETTTPTPTLHTFSYAMMGNSMYTKSATSDDVLSIINSCLPTSISMVLQGQNNGKNYVVQTGQAQSIPSDTYSIKSGSYFGDVIGKEVSSNGASIANTPAISVSQSAVTITDDETNYTVSATYNCFALVCDKTLVESVTFTDAWSGENTIPFVTLNDTMVIFAQGDFNSNYLHLTVTPKDTDTYRVTEYTICTNGASGIDNATKGKWYMIAPATNGMQPKLLEYDLPQMTQGTF